MKIQINHIGKMEGHADFVAEILKGDVQSAKVITTEGARLIEGILIGRHFSEAPIITARICGICPVVHKLSSIKALESAFKIKPTEQTVKLRKLLLLAQIIHSHALHLFFLSLPDFFDLEDDLQMIRQYPKETSSAILVREWALALIRTIGGRAVHPIACEVGGFKVQPTKAELKTLADGYEPVMKQALKLVDLVTKIRLPKFSRETAFVSLTDKKEYALYDGDIKISATSNRSARVLNAQNFLAALKENEESGRAAKSATFENEAFMVGALARLNNNHLRLNPLAAGILRGLKWRFPRYNTFENIIAQAVEIVHALEEAKKILADLDFSLKRETSRGTKLNLIGAANPLGRTAFGFDAIEAPRGVLFHRYGVDQNGYLTKCDIVTPTVSFLNNLEADLLAYIPHVMKMPAKKRIRKIRALIRAYDPCIACATH